MRIAIERGLPADMHLVCTGFGEARRAWLASAAARLQLASRVVAPGFVSAAQLDSLMRHARGVIFPSLYEGFGLPVLEAMAAGIPVACGDRTALPEVAGDAARLFDPRRPGQVAAAMVDLAADDALCARLAAAGRERARKFGDPDALADRYWALLEQAATA
jgi:glycosyltransferase involved in cell wall biosynthesis